MDYPVLMGIIKSHTDLDNDRDGYSPVKMSVLVDQFLNGYAFDIFLNDISEVTLMSYAEHLNDIGVIKRGYGSRLRVEPSDELLIGRELRLHDLNGNIHAGTKIRSKIDISHSALTYKAVDTILSGKYLTFRSLYSHVQSPVLL